VELGSQCLQSLVRGLPSSGATITTTRRLLLDGVYKGGASARLTQLRAQSGVSTPTHLSTTIRQVDL
jgi:hypothetical protein